MTLITLRKGNSGQWLESDRILQTGEPGYDLSNKLLKIGDGTSNWTSLPYYGSGLFSEANHSHTISNITNFNTGVSGLLPNIIGSNYLISNFNANSYILAVTGLQPSGNYANLIHSHNTSEINDFGSGVSGFLPVKNIIASTGIFVTGINGIYSIAVTGLQTSQTSGNYANIMHSHEISDINNFGSGVSGLLPVKNILASTGIFVSGVNGNYSIAVTGNFGLTGSQVDNRVSGYLRAGSGIAFNYNSDNLTINSIATITGIANIDSNDIENVVDNYIDTFLTAGTGINFSYDNNTLTVSSNLVSPPPSATATGNIGQFSYDSEYLYICVNNNLWKRIGLNSW